MNANSNLKGKKRVAGRNSSPASLVPKKPKMYPAKVHGKNPNDIGKPRTRVKFQVPKKYKIYSFAKDVREKATPTGKPKANKANLKKKNSKENSSLLSKVSQKPKTSISTHKFKKGMKLSRKCAANKKTGLEKRSENGKSAQPRKVSVKCKTSASSKKSRKEPKATSKPEVFVKRCQIRYMSSDPFVFPIPSTSSTIPEVANGRPVYNTDLSRRGITRGPLQPIPLILGFVGIGELASSLIPHILRVGIRVLIWNRTVSKCDELVSLGAIRANTPEDLAAESDIVFCCVRGLGAITEVCFGGFYVDVYGIVPGLKRNPRKKKGFVMLSSIRPETSLIISQDFVKVDTEYLEAQVLVNSQSENCDIKILCSGFRSVFDQLPNCFASTKAQFIFVSERLGEASRMKYAHTVTHVGYCLSLIEALAVLRESEKPVEIMSFILEELENVSPILRNKIKDVIFHRRDMGGTIRELKDTLRELYEWYPKKPLHLATAAFEALTYASRKGADQNNISVMYDLIMR